MRKIGMLLLLAGVLVAAEQTPIRTDELSAEMPADLGPTTVDVSTYPTLQRKYYELFLNRCSRCHTPARTINSKITTFEEWEHFVTLMHGKSLDRSLGELWSAGEGHAIVDFLVYDSQVRKIAHAKEFDSLQVRLAERFKLVQIEKERRAKEHPAQSTVPYTTDKR